MTTTYPLYSCVWELTLACNAKCIHCGSSAGAKRPRELTTEEALGLVRELASLGTKSVTLSGGEPLLREDWPIIARAVIDAGMRVELITNGLLVETVADLIADIGFFGVTFSVDGPREIHDHLRGKKDAFDVLMRGAKALKARGVRIGAVTQINRQNLRALESIHEILKANDFDGWQFQLTMAHGEAKRHREAICLDPRELPLAEETMLAIRKRSDMFIQAADNFGYMGIGEATLRGGQKGRENFYRGCSAGTSVVGISADGAIRGCLSMPPAFDEGNIRDSSLTAIWNREGAFSYNRAHSASSLTGACGACPLNTVCRGGCKSLCYAATGAIADNPYCLRRIHEGWE